jgi:hypothetical protein
MMSIMHQTIQSRVSHDRVREQRDPVLRGPVAGDNDRRFEVAFGDDLVEILCLDGGESGESEVINDQDIRS